MKELTEELIIVKCFLCAMQNKLTVMRIENSYPAMDIGYTLPMPGAPAVQRKSEVYICKEHYDLVIPLENDGLQLPKN